MHIAPLNDEHRDNPRAGRYGETVDTVLVRRRRAEKILVLEDIVRVEGVVIVRYVVCDPQSGLACFLVDEPKPDQAPRMSLISVSIGASPCVSPTVTLVMTYGWSSRG